MDNSTIENIEGIKILSIDDVKGKLKELENKYNISSEYFYAAYKQGKTSSSFDTLKWSSYYEIITNEGE